MENVKISPPWLTYSREINKLFERDEEVNVTYDEEQKLVMLRVTNYEKAQALKKLLPAEKNFGGVTVKVSIEYENTAKTLEDYYKLAFKNNPVFKYSFVATTTGSNVVTYIVFEKEVAQFWNDDMSDPHGVTSMLYKDIARDVFGDNGATFSTDSSFSKEKENILNALKDLKSKYQAIKK